MTEKYTDQNLYETYLSRINSVIDYIENHLSEPLTLEELANVANFSRFHFHRIFGAFLGETLSQFIWRLRLEKAAALLINDSKKSITEIALDCGFSSSATFSRSFSSYFKMSPSQWRKNMFKESNLGKVQDKIDQIKGNSREELSSPPLYNRNVELFRRRMNMGKESKNVTIKDFLKSTVAYVRYIGPYAGDEKLFETLFNKLCGWAGPRGLMENTSADFLVIYHDNPEVTEEEKLRTSVCLVVPEDTEVDGDIGKMVIPEGKYAAARFELDATEYGEAWSWVYSQWLPQSGYVPDDRPGFELYPRNEESREEGKMLVYIYVPIKKA